MRRTLKRLLITAGPTREMLDPVRFLSNVSTGEMGYALARVARQKKYRVTLVSGPTMLRPPKGVKFVPVTSACEMQKILLRLFPHHDALIMTAAVCDFTAPKVQPHKIHRTRTRTLLLKQTPDIVARLARRKGRRIVIGFSLETEDWTANAGRKLRGKNLDGIVANYYGRGHVPFGPRRVSVALIDRRRQKMLRRISKTQIAVALLRWMENLGLKN